MTAPPRPASVVIHLTPFAPGCEGAGVDAKARNRTFWFKPLPLVLASVLRRLQRTPAEIRAVQPEGGDEIDLVADVEGPDGPEAQPLACIWAGADLIEVRAALAQLANPAPQGVAA